MTTIPLKDGAPDWRVIELAVYGGETLAAETTLELMRAAYVAALERCSEWHDEQVKPWDKSNTADVDYRNGKNDARKESAAAIRQWIEKEKANG